jgi:thymidylate synthase (FAD)
MKAIYVNHYLTDNDVANFARLSFAKLAENFTDAQNHNLVRFLARGMKSGDWEKLITDMFDLGKIDYASPAGSPMEEQNRKKAHDLAVYMRKIPEHWVPFGHPHITIRMQAPVAIARQLFKHKIGMVESEESRRYISSRPELYIPDTFRAAASDKKQGSAGNHERTSFWKNVYKETAIEAIDMYEEMIKDGVAPEQARFILPQGVEVNWVWTGSLYAFANVANQRLDSHAQQETQELAQVLDAIIAPLFPVSWGALVHGQY